MWCMKKCWRLSPLQLQCIGHGRLNLYLKVCFTKGKSCQLNLLEFIKYNTDCINKGEPVDVIYLAKRFDKYPTKILAKTLLILSFQKSIEYKVIFRNWHKRMLEILKCTFFESDFPCNFIWLILKYFILN